MTHLRSLAAVVCVLAASAGLAANLSSDRHGYVTSIDSATQFSLDGNPIVCDAKTRIGIQAKDQTVYKEFAADALWLGDVVHVTGHEVHGTFVADTVMTKAKQPDDQPSKWSGRTMLYQSQAAAPGETVVVHGWHMRVTRDSKIEFLSGEAEKLPAGARAHYKAERRKDGSVELLEMKLKPEPRTQDETDWGKAQEYQVVAPDFDKHVDGSATLGGQRAVLPSDDEAKAAQAKLQSIGERIWPASKRALPDSDPAKAHLRLYVVKEEGKFVGGVRSPGGQILISAKTVREMSDSEAAAILAIHVAAILQREDYFFRKFRKMEKPILIASIASLALTPVSAVGGLMGAYELGGASGGVEEMLLFADMQDGLELMHVAGFDVMGMPLAMMRLSSKPEKFEKGDGELPYAYTAAMNMRKKYLDAANASTSVQSASARAQ